MDLEALECTHAGQSGVNVAVVMFDLEAFTSAFGI